MSVTWDYHDYESSRRRAVLLRQQRGFRLRMALRGIKKMLLKRVFSTTYMGQKLDRRTPKA